MLEPRDAAPENPPFANADRSVLPGTGIVLSTLLALYAASRFLQVFPGNVLMVAIVALHVFCPAFFALIHGALVYGVRGILIFTVICLMVGGFFENLGVLTGFPYGRYYFTDVMGPKLPQTGPSVVLDPAGTPWRVSDIAGAPP